MPDPRLLIAADLAAIPSGRLRTLSLRWLNRATREFSVTALVELERHSEAERLNALGPLAENTLATADSVLHSIVGKLRDEVVANDDAKEAFLACVRNTREGLYAARQRIVRAPPRGPPTKSEVVFAQAVSVAVIIAAARLARGQAVRSGANATAAEEVGASAEKERQEREVFASMADA